MANNFNPNPYHVDGELPTLRPSVFAFLDILGYRDLTTKAARDDKSQETLRDLHSILDEARVWLDDTHGARPAGDAVKNRFALKAFTDNIAVGWPIRDDAESELVNALSSTAWFQLTMITGGFFIRGAIVIGDAYLDEIAVFGDALTEAYEAESTLARDPRIIVARTAMEAADHHLTYYAEPSHSPQAQLILKDADGQSFVNYLESTIMVDDGNGPQIDMLVSHKEVVEQKLSQYRGDPPKWSKYAWVAGYHDYFCTQYSRLGMDKYKIDPALYERPAPSSIVRDAVSKDNPA